MSLARIERCSCRLHLIKKNVYSLSEPIKFLRGNWWAFVLSAYIIYTRMSEVLIFIAFIVIYTLYVWTTYILVTKYINRLDKDRLIDHELIIVIPNIFLFAFLFVIGRFFNLYIVLISILFSNIGMLLAFIIWALLGSPKVPYKAIGGWAGCNFGIKNIAVSVIFQVLSLLWLMAYPVVIGIYYFKSSSIEETRLFNVQATTIFILGAYILTLPFIVSGLSSSFIDEDSRARFLVSQLAGLIPNALFISLLFWAMKPVQGTELSFGNVSVSFHPLLFTILMSFFIVFFLLPYFVGVQQAKRLKHEYATLKNEILDHVIEAIDLPTSEAITARVEHAEDFISSKYQQLAADDKGVELGVRYDDPNIVNDIPKQEEFIYKCYTLARPYDSRFIYYDFLNETYQKVVELKDRIINETNAATVKEVLGVYSAYFARQKKELNDQHDKHGDKNPVLWLGIIAVASPIVSQVTTEFGKYIITFLKGI